MAMLFRDGGYFIHDAPWRSDYGAGSNLRGGTHGCVNVPLSGETWLWNWAPVGTKRGGRALSATSTPCRWRRHERDERVVLVVNLERGVVDVEAIVEQALQLQPDGVAVVAGVDQHMRAERREARGYLPDVEVVDVGHVGMTGELLADLARLHA